MARSVVEVVIEADGRDGLQGWWQKTVPMQGGQCYRFSVLRKTTGVSVARRSVFVRIHYRDAQGQPVMHDEPTHTSYLPGAIAQAEPEHPADGVADAEGWTEVSGTFRAPSRTAKAVVELHFRWSDGRVEWSKRNEVHAMRERPQVTGRRL